MPAIRALHLEIANAEAVALLGGADGGESSLLRAMAGLVPLDAGDITIDGKPLTSVRDNMRIALGDLGFFPWKTVLENMEFSLRMKGYAEPFMRKRVEDAVRILGIADILGRYPDNLDREHRLRAALACSFAPAFDYLLLDEPTALLPSSKRVRAFALIRRLLSEYPRTCVIATRDAREAVCLAGRIILMHGGGIAKIIDNPYYGLPNPWENWEFIQYCAALQEAGHETM